MAVSSQWPGHHIEDQSHSKLVATPQSLVGSSTYGRQDASQNQPQMLVLTVAVVGVGILLVGRGVSSSPVNVRR